MPSRALRNVRMSFRQADLEPNRLLPVARLLESPQAGLESLRDRIEGLTGAVLDRLQGLALPRIAKNCCWAPRPDAGTGQRGCSGLLSEEERDAVLDLNLAARFLRQRLTEADLKPLHETDRLDYRILRSQ